MFRDILTYDKTAKMLNNSIHSELNYMFKILKILNLLPNNNLEIIRDYAIPILLTLTNAIIYIFIYFNTYAAFGNSTLHKIVIFYYIFSQIVKCCGIGFTMTYHRKDIIKILKELQEFDAICSTLKLRPNSYKYINLPIIIILYMYQTIAGLIYFILNNTDDMDFFNWYFFVTAIILIRAFDAGIRATYLALTTLFTNYCIQINTILGKRRWRQGNAKESIKFLNCVAKFHQEMLDIMKLMHITGTVLIVGQFQESFVVLVSHCYSLIAALYYYETFFAIETSVSALFDGLFNILVFIVSASFYCNKVSESYIIFSYF